MGELYYRVLEVRGQVDPIVLIYRGNEMIVFIKASFAYPQDLSVQLMDRGVDNETAVQRYAAVVREDATPLIPAPVRQPQRVPASQPQRVPAHQGQ
jgi:hypothetical protein